MYWQQIGSEKKSLKKLPVSAKAVLVTKDGKILLMRKSSGIVDLPGGKVEDGEGLFETLYREVKEETGLKVNSFDFVASWVKHHAVLGDRLVVVFEGVLKKKAKNLSVKMSKEHGWCDYVKPEIIDEIGDMPPGYGNAILICAGRHQTRSAKRKAKKLAQSSGAVNKKKASA